MIPRTSTCPVGRLTNRSPSGAACLSIGLFVVVLAVYWASPIETPFDSRWSIHTAMSFLRGNAGDLTEYMPILEKHAFYEIEWWKGRPHTMFPIGVSLLALPVVIIHVVVHPHYNDGLKESIPVGIEKRVASFYGAVAGVIFFWLIVSQFGSWPTAFAATIIFCFGTSMWSTATRALWQHGPMVLMVVIAMLLLLHARRRPVLAQYAGLPLAMAFVIRPTAALPIAALSIYVAVYHRACFVRYMLWAMVIAVPWLVYNVLVCGSLLPPYYLPTRLESSSTFTEALLGNLVSPGRGLFVFSPVLLFAPIGFMCSLQDHDERPLNITFGLIVLLHWVFVSSFPHWWVGHSFGPRVMIDILPFLAFFVAFTFRLGASMRVWTRASVVACIGLLGVVSVLIHAQGALRSGPYEWNNIPRNIDEDHARLWDWRDLQFARRKAPRGRSIVP